MRQSMRQSLEQERQQSIERTSPRDSLNRSATRETEETSGKPKKHRLHQHHVDSEQMNYLRDLRAHAIVYWIRAEGY